MNALGLDGRVIESAADTFEEADKSKRPAAVEQDMVEMGADKLRLFKIEG